MSWGPTHDYALHRAQHETELTMVVEIRRWTIPDGGAKLVDLGLFFFAAAAPPYQLYSTTARSPVSEGLGHPGNLKYIHGVLYVIDRFQV